MSILLGLLTGVAFGFVLQRGRVCFNSAFRDLRMMKDNFMFKAGLLAIAVQIIAFLAMSQLGLIHLNPKPLNLIGSIVGGYIFGLGMVLAGGCASGTTYRISEGNTTAWLAGLVYGIFAWATQSGFLSPLMKAISQFNITVAPNSALYLGEQTGPTLATMLNINPWIAGLVVAALLFAYLFGTKTTPRDTATWGWIKTGLLVVPVAMFGFWSSTISGRPYGLGITGGWINILKAIQTNELLNWEGAEVLGIMIGAGITAVIFKEFKLRVPKNGKTFLYVVAGGVLMGFGAVFAGGCNIGHFLTGIPQLAISSIVAGIFFILGNWTMVRILYGKS
ncbi:transporter [Ornatilinea apprima]|uniref:Transporter n=1 Tax=Ornatilinea apprima TaxID=1134406 RepID=A0A0P6X539_9CHLR|nr:YeeE/YedE family protein [Ornatilinea apprima]KPL69985.1 transporter [Ornatilinea apprima]